jgi:hypothetical protein
VLEAGGTRLAKPVVGNRRMDKNLMTMGVVPTRPAWVRQTLPGRVGSVSPWTLKAWVGFCKFC